MKRVNLKDKNLNEDLFFSVLMQNKVFCQKVLSIILEKEFIDLEYKQIQKTYQNLPGYKSIRLDVYAKDKKGKQYAIEMQKRNVDDLPKRSRYYQGLLDVSGLLSGKDVKYAELPETYIIFITDFDLFGEGLYKYTFQNECQETKLELGDETKKIFLNTKGKKEEGVPQTLVRFLKYVEQSTWDNAKEDNQLMELHKMVEQLKVDEEMEGIYMNLLWAKEEAREEGREEGMKEGLKEGMKEGIKEGIKEGMKEGMKEGIRLVAVNLLDIMEDEKIAEKTGLEIEEIKRLRKKEKKE